MMLLVWINVLLLPIVLLSIVLISIVGCVAIGCGVVTTNVGGSPAAAGGDGEVDELDLFLAPPIFLKLRSGRLIAATVATGVRSGIHCVCCFVCTLHEPLPERREAGGHRLTGAAVD